MHDVLVPDLEGAFLAARLLEARELGRREGVAIASEELHEFPRRQVGVLDPDVVAAVEEWARAVLRGLQLARVDAVGERGR